uniref:Uncharacterized protein n=1 Tax=Panagrellus redivivus TaxID=6233 RepID=A0A7E4VAH6_PANRE
MTTAAMDVHFVRNNPFILNDPRFGRSGPPPPLPTSASSTHVPLQRRTPVQVSQSASCSNIQRTVVRSRFEDPSALPPAPHSVYRRFQLLEQTSVPSSPKPVVVSSVKVEAVKAVPPISEMKLCSKHRSRSLGPLDVNSNHAVTVDTSSDEEGSVASRDDDDTVFASGPKSMKPEFESRALSLVKRLLLEPFWGPGKGCDGCPSHRSQSQILLD